MKVLLLHQHFNTPQKGGAIRSYYLARALVEKGVSVVVIAGYNGRKYFIENTEGIEVHYLPVPYYNRFGFYKRGFSFIRYVQGAIRLSQQFKDFDLVYAISTPLTVGMAAMRIQKLYKIPFLFEVGDLWPDAPIELGFVKSKFLQKSLFALEKRIYEKAAEIVALSDAIKAGIEKKVSGKKVHVLPNMADTEFFAPQKKNHELEKKFGVEGKFVVSYIGAIGYANGLDYFLECARASKKSSLPVRFFICGEGAMLGQLKLSASNLGLDNLTFVSFKNREGVRDLFNITDANFISYRPVAILETGSPNKYFDGLAAGKLTIINFAGWVKEEIEKAECGIALHPNRPSEFADRISPFLEDQKLLSKFQSAARSLAQAKYSRVALGEQFYHIIQNPVNDR